MKNNRLFRLLYYVLSKRKVTASQLADHYEVSIRTIYRDIDNLSSVGIPIYATQGKGGGIEISRDFILNQSLLSQEEKEQIMNALQGLGTTSDLSDKNLLIKLSALFNMEMINWIEVDFQGWNSTHDTALFQNLKLAILNKNLISFDYFSHLQETTRIVKPIRLWFKGFNWYLYAFCLSRNDYRIFKLSRIKNLKTLKERYEDSFEEISLNELKVPDNMISLQVKFDKRVAYRVYDEIATEIIVDENGDLLTTIELPNDERMVSYLFSFGSNIEVLQPKEIRLQIKQLIQTIGEKYKT